MFSSIVAIIFAIVVMFPFIVTFLALSFYKKRGKAPANMLGEAADWTTFFLFASVYILARSMFDFAIGFYMMMTFVLIVIVFAVYERIKVKDFKIIRLMRKVWRLSFILLFVAYVGILITGLVLKIIEYAK